MARKKSLPAQIKIRLPEKLRRALEREAAKNGRTLNGEIVYRLTEPIAVMESTERAMDQLMAKVTERVAHYLGGTASTSEILQWRSSKPEESDK
jgi:hypothetical protein